MNGNPKRILVIKLADIGDVLTATPALRALRQTFPEATIDLLLTHHTQPVMQYSKLVDHLIPSDNFRFFHVKDALQPGLLQAAIQVLRTVRRRGFDTVVVLHHLTTTAGTLKYALLARFSGATTVVGLARKDNPARFLTQAAPDLGFGARHEIDYWLDVVALLGATTANREPELPVSAADRAWAGLMRAIDAGPQVAAGPQSAAGPLAGRLVVLHPGSGGFSPARRWPAAHFAAVADALNERGGQVVLVGTFGDGSEAVKAAMQTQPVDLTGQTTLHQLAALLQQADLFIGGDSGVTHIAATSGAATSGAASGPPMVAIFGPTNASAWGPRGPQRVVLQADIACGPCAYVGHVVGLRFGCPARTCLQLVTPAHVIEVAESLLAGSNEGDITPTPDAQGINYFNMRLARSVSQQGADFPAVNMLGVRVHAVTLDQTLAAIDAFIASGQSYQVCTVNPEFVVTAQKDAVFRRVINRAALAFADGMGLLIAARRFGRGEFPERVAGVDVVETLAARSAERGYRLYFLGAQPGVAQKAIEVLMSRYPGMQVAGAYAGSPRAEDEAAIVAKIQAAQPNIVLVAYGAPRQDKWIARNMHRLPPAVLMGVGGAFDFISGTTQRAPRWMQRVGLEWLHRFVKQPTRWRRMWNAVPRFLWLVWRAGGDEGVGE